MIIVFLCFSPLCYHSLPSCFFFNDTAPPEIYTLSLHDALPISRGNRVTRGNRARGRRRRSYGAGEIPHDSGARLDRKSTRLNSSHVRTSYAVFCLKKKIIDATTASGGNTSALMVCLRSLLTEHD